MTVRWEYLHLVWSRRVELKEVEVKVELDAWTEMDLIDPGPASTTKSEWHHSDTFEIWRPGAEKAEELEGWSSGTDTSTPFLTRRLLNELGAEGWELVDRSVGSNSAGKSRLGWNTASWPVEIIWTMKRPIASS